MASHKIAIEFVHLTTNGEKDIIHTYAYWDGRRSADSRNKAVIDVHPGGDIYLYTGGYPRRKMLWATYTIIS